MVTGKKVGLGTYIITIIILLAFALFFGWGVWKGTYQSIKNGRDNNMLVSLAQLPSRMMNTFRGIKPPTNRPVKNSSIMFINRHSQTTDFIVNGDVTDTGYILLTGFDKNIGESSIRLFSLQKRKVVYTWHVSNEELKKIAPDTVNPSLFDKVEFANLHPLMTADSGLILKAEYAMVYKIDNHSKIQWVLHGNYHHSIEQDADGNFWTSEFAHGYDFDSTIYENYIDNRIDKISPDGKLLASISITKSLVKAGYESLLFGVGPYENSPLHINDIEPALTTTPYWQKNDLLISLHNRSTVILYRPSTDEIVWLKTGPWLNQHDVNFVSNNSISVFGNDILRGSKQLHSLHGHNELYVYNFQTQDVQRPYSPLFKKEGINTNKSGRGLILNNQDIIIEETHYSRVIRANKNRIIWSYQDIIDSNWVAKICWSRYYTTLPFHRFKK